MLSVNINDPNCLTHQLTRLINLAKSSNASRRFINNLIKRLRRTDRTNNDLIFTVEKTPVCCICKFIHRHTQSSALVAHVVVYFSWEDLIGYSRVWGQGHYPLCTGGGEISMTLTFVFRRLSRRQRVKTFKAALDPQNAGSVAAGTMVMLEPVLVFVSICPPTFNLRVSLQDNAGCYVFLRENRDKRMRKRDKANIVDMDFVLKPLQIEARRITQVVNVLGTGIEE